MPLKASVVMADAPTDDTPGQPFVRVLRDQDTGRTVVALDDRAAQALDLLLDGIDVQDLLNDDLGWMSEQERDDLARTVGQIKGQMGKLLRGF